jgi:hypothetical protein
MKWVAGLLLVGTWLGCSSDGGGPAGMGSVRDPGDGNAGGRAAAAGGNAGSAGALAGGRGGSGGSGGPAANADVGTADRPPPPADARGGETTVYPEYNATGALVRPIGWEQWIFLGSALNLSYSTGAPPTTDILSVVYMEPTAYRHFKTTGEFREGTMTALATYRTAAAGPPAERGIVPTAPIGFEMSVKDRAKTPEGWGFYSFDGGPTATRGTARPFPRSACFDCHAEHAETDRVFTQYYPALP